MDHSIERGLVSREVPIDHLGTAEVSYVAAHFSTFACLCVLKPGVWHYRSSHLRFLEPEMKMTPDYRLGAVLTKLHPDNTERIIAFASRTYPAVKHEQTLACI